MPRARVNRAGAKRIRGGHVWVFRSDIERPPDARGGAVVVVEDPQGNPLGQAWWAARSKLSLRLLTRNAAEPIDPGFWRARFARSLARRQQMMPGREAFRVVHGESDEIPGLLVDRYGDALSIQTLAEATDLRKAELAGYLDELLHPRTIVFRDDGSSRDFEGLPRTQGFLKGDDRQARYREGENAFEIDLLADGKTGSFLDQQENHLAARAYARGRGLDCFSYHGGFALSLARGCEAVTAVEQDERAASRISSNALANGLANVVVRPENAFDVLKELDKAQERFDIVVLDPPAFAKRAEGLDTALRAYKELNLRAVRLLAPDGILITCSCSAKLIPEAFEAMVLDAAQDAGRLLQLLERRGASRDHPMLASVPETAYLKTFIYRAL